MPGSYTMPQNEHQFLDVIQAKCLRESVYVTKSEILRVGLMTAKDMPIKQFLRRVESLIKTGPGRPRKSDDSKGQ